MTHRDPSRVASVLAFIAVILLFLPNLAFAARGLYGGVDFDPLDLRLAVPGPVGIDHDLDPGDWVSFRVRILHEDSQFPLVGFASDNFTPTANDIQVCDVSGCETPRISVPESGLDWTDYDKITVYLEAKSCVLCSWTSYEMEYSP